MSKLTIRLDPFSLDLKNHIEANSPHTITDVVKQALMHYAAGQSITGLRRVASPSQRAVDECNRYG